MKALNFGSLNLDYVYQVPHFVQPGETLSALSQGVFPGGKGLNQSVALAKAGAEVWHAGCLGQGGAMLKQVLQDSGVKLDHLIPVSEIQGNAVIQVNPEGQNCILLFGGSNQCVTAEQIEKTFSCFEAGDCLILQNEVNALSEIVNAGAARGMKIFLNPSPFNKTIDTVDLSKISWLLMNEIEAEQHSNHLSDAGIVIFTTVPPPSRGEITILPLHIISSLCLILFRAICGSWSPAELKPEPSSSTIISLPPFV